MIQLLSNDNSVLMQVSAIEREGNNLLIKGKVLGTMPMTAKLSPRECRNAFKMLSLRLVLFLITLPFRRG